MFKKKKSLVCNKSILFSGSHKNEQKQIILTSEQASSIQLILKSKAWKDLRL